jgi:hypothetical protein
VCGFLLAVPSTEHALVNHASVPSDPRPSEPAPALPTEPKDGLASEVAQVVPVELATAPPATAEVVAPVVAPVAAPAPPDAIAAMSIWWSLRSNQQKAAPRKARFVAHKFRRHQQTVQREQGCPPSVCSGAVAILPDPSRWERSGN